MMIQANGPRILVCTGPTGGHFFPAMRFARALKATHPTAELHLIVNRMPSFINSSMPISGVHVHTIPLEPIGRAFSFSGFSVVLTYLRAFVSTLRLEKEIQPSLVVGFGSYATVPGVLCGALLGVPILLHEQNVRSGRANRFLSFWADRVAVSFPNAEVGIPSRKVFWSGYPLREQFDERIPASSEAQASARPFTFLVLGGSQGARRLNELFLGAIKQFKSEEKSDFAVIHITGSDHLDGVRETYQALEIKAEVDSFSDRMKDHFRAADLVISRAGAGTIFELAAIGRAAILVPYRFAHAHQKANSRYLAKRGCARVLEEEKLTAERLLEDIRTLYHDQNVRNRLADRIRQLGSTDAHQTLVDAAWKLRSKKI